MRAGAARGHEGHFHEAGFYDSDAQFRDLIVGFVQEGIAAREPVIIGYDERKNDLVRSWVGDSNAVTFIRDKGLYARPARAIATYRQLFERHVAAGAQQIRIAGDVPHPGNGAPFGGWDRYEWAVNSVWQPFPVWGRCLYDARTVPAPVRDVVERTHPRLLAGDGRQHPNERYQANGSFEPLPPEPDPIEAVPPTMLLVDPPPEQARHTIASIGRGHLPDDTLHDLVLGTSEAVTNARRHGRAPTTVRIWAGARRVVVRVHDTGPGPSDRLAGLVPVASVTSGRGLGLWITHQLDLDVDLFSGPDGFTVRLRAGR